MFVFELSGCGFKSSCSHLNFRFATASTEEFLDIQATIECAFTLKDVCDMTRTYRRTILSAIKTPTYKLANVLAPFLNPLNSNEYTVMVSFAYDEERVKQDSEVFFMGSLDVHSLFNKILLEETINICTKKWQS